ncbi:MAG TPA: succinylglutamate desuccinylase/aspartoacylase family protein [Alphaproteobacteria bacterium]|nr:succinylglutamate desuccinylase/aspartoacylase family protein [Alphaproteobacteria bacterium]
MPESLITTDIDFEAEGVQTGVLRVPHSHNRSAYGHIPIPIWVARRGRDPTVLMTGANHGDEYEGPVALMRFMRDFRLDRLSGRIIVIPALNFPAYLAGTRVSPIDGVNLNRAFPGDPRGTVTEMIADYVESVLMPMTNFCFDFHAGGSSLNYLPTLFAFRHQDAAAQARMDRLVEAFGAPRAMIMDMLGEDRVISAGARRKGVLFLTGEFGGGATINLDGLEIVRRGIEGVLDSLEVLPMREPRRSPAPIRRLVVKGAAHYLFAPVAGIFEPLFRLGDEVEAGQPAGYIHDPVQPWREPTPVAFKGSGLVLCVRTFTLVSPGDCLAHLAADET